MLDQTVSIAGKFNSVSYSDWKSVVDKMIGSDADEKLVLKSIEGFEIKPLEIESIQTVHLNTYPADTTITTSSIASAKGDIDATSVHNAGASIIQEVAFILNEFSKKLEQSECLIHLCCDSLYFSNIAKLRAIRFCCERMIEESNSKLNFEIICHNSLREQTLFDPWVNMLRSTASSMAAIIGGANQISSLSYDHLYSTLSGEKESSLGRRQADNILKILLEESHLSQVNDPMKGSYSVDNMTYQIINNSWDKFIAGIDIKVLAQEVAEVAKKRYALTQTRKWTVTGVNNFANPEETINSIYKSDGLFNFDSEGDFPLRTIASEFETLRSQVKNKAMNIQIGVFGDEAKLSARVNFCKNYFELIGANVCESTATTKISNLITDYKDQKAQAVILCAIDEDYTNHGQELIDAYQEAGVKIIYLAGRPKDLKLDGLTDNLYMGQNVFDVLSAFVKEVS